MLSSSTAAPAPRTARSPRPASPQTRAATLERSALGDLALLGRGGQGTVWRAPRARLSYSASAAFKEYKPEWRSRVDFGALGAMSAFLGARTFDEGLELASRVSWPAFVVADGGTPVGFLMAEVPGDFRVEITTPSGGRDRVLAQLQHLLNGPGYLAKRGIGISDRQRYRLLAHAAGTLALLHGHGITVGDLSPKNVLFTLEPEPRCFLVDADAMRLAGRSTLPQAETPDWEAPAGEELATTASDAYKFGLLALRLLAGDQSTRDPVRLPAQVPADLRDLVARSLSAAPGARPAASAWAGPLAAAAARASAAAPAAPAPARPAAPAPAHAAPGPAGPRGSGPGVASVPRPTASAVSTFHVAEHYETYNGGALTLTSDEIRYKTGPKVKIGKQDWVVPWSHLREVEARSTMLGKSVRLTLQNGSTVAFYAKWGRQNYELADRLASLLRRYRTS